MLRGVDFDVPRGSIFALLGSNGAGKTAIVKFLSTLLKADAGTAKRQRLRCRHAGCGRAGVDRPHRTVRGRRRNPERAREPRAGRPVAAGQGPGRDRGRPARSFLADRRGHAEGVDVLERHAPSARHRDEPHRESAGHLPRRANDRARPRSASRCGRPSRNYPSTAPRCCSRRSTWTRPNSSPTASRSSTRVGSS